MKGKKKKKAKLMDLRVEVATPSVGMLCGDSVNTASLFLPWHTGSNTVSPFGVFGVSVLLIRHIFEGQVWEFCFSMLYNRLIVTSTTAKEGIGTKD